MPFDPQTLTFDRVWRFTDLRAPGDDITRGDMDAALDDIAAGINAALSNGIYFIGDWLAGAPFPSARADGSTIQARDLWRVTAAGTTGGVAFALGDLLMALREAPGRTYTNNWMRIPEAAYDVVLSNLASVTRFRFSADLGQTVFTGLDDNGKTLQTTAITDVILDGVLLDETEYSIAPGGLTITLDSGAPSASSVLKVHCIGTVAFTQLPGEVEDAAIRAESAADRAEAEAGFDTIPQLVAFANQVPSPVVAGREYRAAGYSFRGLAAPGTFFATAPYLRTGRDWAFAGQWGAVGDGVADDQDALNAALNDCRFLKGEPGAIYRSVGPVTILSNSRFDGYGSKLRRGVLANSIENQWLLRTEKSSTTWDASNIIIENLDVEDAPGCRGMGVLLVGDNIRVRGYRLVFSQPYDALRGAWSNYISGNNISITGDIFVDTTAAGLWSDCMHLGYVKNFHLGGHILKGGDDAIALYPPARSYAWKGRNLAAENITIEPGYSESLTSHAIRIGAQGDFTVIAPGENESDPNVVFKNVNVVAETVGDSYTPVTLEDLRGVSFINGQHDNISMKIIMEDQSIAFRTLSMFGNPDTALAANRNQKNFGKVRLEIVGRQKTVGTASPGEQAFGGGVSRLELAGDLISDLSATSSTNHVTVRQIDDLVFDGCTIKTDTTANFASLNYVRRLHLRNIDAADDGNAEFATFAIVLNGDQDTSVYCQGGRITDTARTFNISGTGAMKDFHLTGTDILGSGVTTPNVSAVTSWTGGGTVLFAPARRIFTTVANLMGSGIPVADGSAAFVTDANATTPGGVVAGGGSNIVPVFRRGTDWRIG